MIRPFSWLVTLVTLVFVAPGMMPDAASASVASDTVCAHQVQLEQPMQANYSPPKRKEPSTTTGTGTR